MRRRVYLILALAVLCDKTFTQTAYTEMRGLSGLEITAEMAPGINLVNTLDAVGTGLSSETYWGQPYTTIEMITSMKEKGFKTLRIPVTWFNHTGPAPDYTIDTEWMDRVEEVANYAFTNNMYVIINMHHEDLEEGKEGSWICTTYEKQDAVSDQLVKMWTQIAERFKDYSDYLVFETMNEPREVGGEMEWTGGTAEHRDVMNQLNKAAVDAIRATGGNNETRFIMLPQVGANVSSALGDMIIPDGDTNTIVSVHAYSPYDFCLNDNGTSRWKTDERSGLEGFVSDLYDEFIAHGQAVVMGEWGAKNKDNYADRVLYYDAYSSVMEEYQIAPMIWIYSFNRSTLTWSDEFITEAMLRPYRENVIEVESLSLNADTETLYKSDTFQLGCSIEPIGAVPGVAWTSYDSKIARVDQSGLVTAMKAGRTTILAATYGRSIECEIEVLDTTENPCQDELFIALNAGGDEEECFEADGYFTGGELYSNSDVIIIGDIEDPAPPAVYNSSRYGDFNYTITDLDLNTDHKVRLHFSEVWWGSSGQRSFNVVINDETVLENYDIYAMSGGKNTAIIEEFDVSSGMNGQIVIEFATNVDNAMINGIEIINMEYTGISIPDNYQEEALVYPNPVSGFATIRLPKNNTEFDFVSIYDIQGRLIKTIAVENNGIKNKEIRIDCTGLSGGVYYCKITSAKGHSIIAKFLVNGNQ